VSAIGLFTPIINIVANTNTIAEIILFFTLSTLFVIFP
jgi:hypothetical protein